MYRELKNSGMNFNDVLNTLYPKCKVCNLYKIISKIIKFLLHSKSLEFNCILHETFQIGPATFQVPGG